MTNEHSKTIVFTGAPEAADYSHTTTLECFEHTDFPGSSKPKAWRKVEINADRYRTNYQCDRYGSFLGGCTTLDDPRTHPLGTGRQAPSNYSR